MESIDPPDEDEEEEARSTGRQTPTPGRHTPTPGRHTPTPGRHTPTPGSKSPRAVTNSTPDEGGGGPTGETTEINDGGEENPVLIEDVENEVEKPVERRVPPITIVSQLSFVNPMFLY